MLLFLCATQVAAPPLKRKASNIPALFWFRGRMVMLSYPGAKGIGIHPLL